MLNKRVFSLFALFSILLVGCNDPIKQNYLDRKSKIENFLSYDDTPRYYYEKKDGWRRQPDSFNDESNFVLNAIKSNVPQEVTFEECKKIV